MRYADNFGTKKMLVITSEGLECSWLKDFLGIFNKKNATEYQQLY